MDRIKKIVKEIKDEKVDVDKFINKVMSKEEITQKEQICYKLLDIVRDVKKSNSDIDIGKILETYISKHTSCSIIKIVENSLIHYNNCKALRELEEKNIVIAKMLIKDIFERCIVRFDPYFCNNYQIYNLNNETELEMIATSLETLTMYYISYGYIDTYICNDIKDEINISDELCLEYVKCYERNYCSLRNEYIISKLREM